MVPNNTYLLALQLCFKQTNGVAFLFGLDVNIQTADAQTNSELLSDLVLV